MLPRGLDLTMMDDSEPAWLKDLVTDEQQRRWLERRKAHEAGEALRAAARRQREKELVAQLELARLPGADLGILADWFERQRGDH